MTRRCAVCGDEGADILCGKCKRFVCEDCYDDEAGACVKCMDASRARRGAPVRSSLLVAGFGLAPVQSGSGSAGLSRLRSTPSAISEM